MTMNKSKIISAGIAIFAMLFGAGNIVYPLAIGKETGQGMWWAIAGFTLTGVLVPLLGIIVMMLYDGSYKKFLNQIGVIPGALIAAVCMALIGPFGCISRCVTLSHAAIAHHLPWLSLFMFSIIAAALLFATTLRKTGIMTILGRVLGPLKLVLLGSFIVRGLWMEGSMEPTLLTSSEAFKNGFFNGYLTLDLLGGLFFGGLILSSFRADCSREDGSLDYHKVLRFGGAAGLIGAILLGIIYLGFCIVAAKFGRFIEVGGIVNLLSALAVFILGSHAGVLANITIAVSCFATATALTTVFADYVRREICQEKIGYLPALLITIVATAIMTNFGFAGIMSAIAPVVVMIYPALIVMAVLSIIRKLFDINFVKIPVIMTLAGSVVVQYWQQISLLVSSYTGC